LEALENNYPESRDLINIELTDSKIPDPFDKEDPHQAARTYNIRTPL